MLEIETTIEMMVDMSGLFLLRQPDRDNDITYRLVNDDKIYFVVFNTEYSSINAHEIKCSSVVDINSVITPDLLYCKPIISIESSDMCERFNTVVEIIKNAI